MKNYLFANYRFVPHLFLAVFALSLLSSGNAFSQNSKNSRITAAANAYTNFIVDFGDDEEEIFALVNEERRKKRLSNLDWDDDLARVARKYSQQMAKGNFFGHFDRNGDGVEQRADAAKIQWDEIGENLYFCQGLQDFNTAAVKGWMNSPGHRQNILHKSWTDSGIGVAESRDGKIYVTQVFIRK
jgi:uncharacterized protein YkwD